MANKLQSYFPLIQTEAEVLKQIYSDRKLLLLFLSWSDSQQKEFLDFCTGVKGIKITYDSFFKEALNPEYSTAPLDSMLSAFLGFPVHIVTVLPNDSTRISDETSLLITDIVVELEDGSLADVEIQKIGYAFPGERCACYGADLLLRQYRRVRGSKGDLFSYRDIKNVYLIVIFEDSPAECCALPGVFIHRGETVFSDGLPIHLLQKYIFISLDIFKETMHNKPIRTTEDAWLTFLSCDEPEKIIELITAYPEFKPLYETLYRMCRNMEDIMGFWSEELRELDRNTVYYMIDQLQQKADDLSTEVAEKETALAETENALTETENALAETENALAETETALAEKESALTETENTLTETKNALAETKNALAEKESALTEAKAVLAETKTVLAEKDAEIARLRKQLEEKDI